MKLQKWATGALVVTLAAVLNAGCRSPAQLGFAMPPAGAVGGEPFLVQPVIEVQDKNGKLVEKDGVQVTLALESNEAGGTLSGTSTAVTVKGRAEFKNLSIDRAGQGYTLLAVAGELAKATSAPFAVKAGAPAGLRLLTAPPAEAVVNEKWAEFSVELLDVAGNRAVSATDPVSVSLSSPAGSKAGLLKAPSLTVTPRRGIASFRNIAYTKPGPITISMTAGSLPPVVAGISMKEPVKKKAAAKKAASKKPAKKPAAKKKK